MAQRVLDVLVVVHVGVDVVEGGPECGGLALGGRLALRPRLLLPTVELLPTEGVDEHRVLLEILFQRVFLHEEMSIFVIDENFLVLQVIYCLIVDIVDGVGVVQGVGGRLLPANKELSRFSVSSPPL